MAPDIVADQSGRKTESYRPKQIYQHYTIPRNPKRESERLRTFINWNVGFLDSKNLAKAGFYYTNVNDVIKCAFCDVEIGCWEEGDNPEQDHERLSPNCPFLKGQDCGNKVQSENGEESEENVNEEIVSQDVCGSHGLEIRPFSAPERPGKVPFAIEPNNLWKDFEELGVTEISGPVSPYYATYINRLKTFKDWKKHEIQNPEKLAEAGFYYTSLYDNVLCFHCGGGLKNWEADDDPWVEHARWFSRCGFVILSKGREFVNEVLSKGKAQLTLLASKKLKENAEKSTEVGQQKENLLKERSATKPSLISPKVSSTSIPEKESQGTQSSNSETKEEIELCRICYQRERGIVFIPCGHFVSCTQCALSLSTCAVCRKPFEAKVRAYLS